MIEMHPNHSGQGLVWLATSHAGYQSPGGRSESARESHPMGSRSRHARLVAACFLAILLAGHMNRAAAMETWSLVTNTDAKHEAAIMTAIADLQRTGKELGISFQHVTEIPTPLKQVVVVGDVTRNRWTAKLVRDGQVRLEGVTEPHAFEMRTVRSQETRLLVVAGGSVLGDVYGLYWLWDRMRVHKKIVDLNVIRKPAMPIRFAGADSPTEIRNALRHSANWIASDNILDLVPWNAEPQRSQNEANREQMRDLIESAHAHRLKILSNCDEFSCHPLLLSEFGATLDPADPAFWKALQAKYRRLLRALPGLDGVQIRTGELTRVAAPYEAFDVMHDAPQSGWSLEKRYKTFVKKMHEVVVGEFDKIYFQRTWVTNATEHHSNPEVFRNTFTDDVPARNLFLSPYLSLADRWYHQPYNPTFNLTPHRMVVLLATLDYHAHGGVNVFPSFPGAYHQGGLKSILAANESNLAGVQFDVPASERWNSRTLTAYTVFRLAWDPDESIRQIAEDYAAIYLGSDVAPEMADILLLSHQAYKDGIYIKPVAERIRGNTLPHLRLTVFQLGGVPAIDKGRAHINWLESTMYAPAKSNPEEALAHLDRGLRAAVQMDERYRQISDRVVDPALAKQVGDSLKLTRLLVETNNRYVKTCFAYFQYREHRNSQYREKLSKAVAELKETAARFRNAPQFCYQLYGVDQLIENADAALENLQQAESILANAVNEQDAKHSIVELQERHADLLDEHPDAVKVLSWRGMVDGQEMLRLRGNSLEVEHLKGDGITHVEHQVFAELPKREVSVLVKDRHSRNTHPYVLEQPTADNDYTARIHLSDKPPGYGLWEFDVYFLDNAPTKVGVAAPWQ